MERKGTQSNLRDIYTFLIYDAYTHDKNVKLHMKRPLGFLLNKINYH